MQRILSNIIHSKAPLMVILRSVLLIALIGMGVARLRLTLILLTFPENYQQHDVLQMYLMAKALVNGLNPYLPLSDLASKFVGEFTYFPHPAPYPPFIAVLFAPLTLLNIKTAIVAWYIFEILCLAGIACMLTIFFTGRLKGFEALISFFLLLAWFPVMAGLEVGQLSILLTLLLLAALLAMQRKHMVLAGVLIGFSVAIKLITWPLIVYMILKKEWRAAIASSITALGLNLVALSLVGINHFSEYYLQVSSQVLDVYHKFWANFSLFTLGYRLFDGTDSAIFANNYHALPLIYLPGAASLVSLVLMAIFLIASLYWAVRSPEMDTAFAILVCLIVIISPIVWDHYLVILIISLAVMIRNLIRHSFPATETLIYMLIVLLMFMFNDQIGTVMVLLNGGKDLVEASGGQVTFSSTLISWLPLVEMVALSILLWRSGVRQKRAEGDQSMSNSTSIQRKEME